MCSRVTPPLFSYSISLDAFLSSKSRGSLHPQVFLAACAARAAYAHPTILSSADSDGHSAAVAKGARLDLRLAIVDATNAQAAVVLPSAQAMSAASMQAALPVLGDPKTAGWSATLYDVQQQPHMVAELTQLSHSTPSPSEAGCCVSFGKVLSHAVPDGSGGVRVSSHVNMTVACNSLLHEEEVSAFVDHIRQQQQFFAA